MEFVLLELGDGWARRQLAPQLELGIAHRCHLLAHGRDLLVRILALTLKLLLRTLKLVLELAALVG